MSFADDLIRMSDTTHDVIMTVTYIVLVLCVPGYIWLFIEWRRTDPRHANYRKRYSHGPQDAD
jgi:hypothetical protein